MDIDYKTPGFGILLSEIDTTDPFETSYGILYRLGDQTYSLEETVLKQQSHNTSGIFYTQDDNYKLHITFYKTDNKVWMTRTYIDSDGQKQVYGSAWITGGTLSEALPDYHIGFYSNIGNTIRRISIATGMPKDWVVNIRNTNGGRVSFHADGFTIEECEYDADVEQQNIELEKGTYWLDYLKTPEDSDIQAFVNIALKDKETEGHLTNKPTLLDKTKSILQEDGHFTLTEKTKVNLKFSGTNGTIDNITIKDLKDSSYISTDDTGNNTREGSCIIIDLTKIQTVEWTGVINAIPDTKLTEKPTYSVFNGDPEDNRTIQDAGITLTQEYDYSYTNHAVTVHDRSYAIDPDSEKLYIFHNINGVITKLVVTYMDGKQVDIINSLTYKIYISDIIESPIIITDLQYNPYDLSAAYREVVIPKTQLDLFNKHQAGNLTQRVDKLKSQITVYGVTEGAKIDKSGKTIDQFASSYARLSPSQYSFDIDNNTITAADTVWSTYKYIVVQYTGADYFTYVFTNWEREWFDLHESSILQFEKPVSSETTGKFLIYGIKEDTPVYFDYLYRVSSESMLNSIDLFAASYDTLSSEVYTINTTKKRIFIREAIRAQYRYIVVDYLKDDSYAINHQADIGEYEVDVSTDNEKSLAIYDMEESGAIGRYNLTYIVPQQDTYITAAKKVTI